jgi:hypothetical protein
MSDAPSGGWTVSYAKQAEKDIARLDAKLRRRILLAIGRLAADPDTATAVRKLTGRPIGGCASATGGCASFGTHRNRSYT